MLSGSISQILKSQRSLKKDLPWHLPGRTAKLSKLGFWHVCVVLQESLTDLAFPQMQPTVREKNAKQNWGLCDLWHQVKKTYGFPVCCRMRMSFPGFFCKESSIGLDLTKLRTSTWPSPDATERGVQPWRSWDNRAAVLAVAIWCKVGKWPALEFVQIWFPFWSSLQSFQTL